MKTSHFTSKYIVKRNENKYPYKKNSQMPITALLIIATKRKPTRCLFVINKQNMISYTMGYSLTTKRNEVLIHAIT